MRDLSFFLLEVIVRLGCHWRQPALFRRPQVERAPLEHNARAVASFHLRFLVLVRHLGYNYLPVELTAPCTSPRLSRKGMYDRSVGLLVFNIGI